jgi:hypothetical protein
MKTLCRVSFLAAFALLASGCKPSFDVPTDQQAMDALYSPAFAGVVPECVSFVEPNKDKSPECIAARQKRRDAFVVKVEKCNDGAHVPMMEGVSIPSGVTCTIAITFDETQKEPQGRVAVFFKAAGKWNGSLL